MIKNLIVPIVRNEFDLYHPSKAIRHAYHDVKQRAFEFRHRGSADSLSALSKIWWYYTAELAPGITAAGAIPREWPFGPRMLMRKCSLAGMDCVDLGTMEGIMPVLMRRSGAKTVVAADAVYHCYRKLKTLQRQYDVDFEFEQVGLMYDLDKKLAKYGGFDLVVLGGVLYHVFSPLHVLAGVRPLLKKNGILIVSTNVVRDAKCTMLFNDAGRLQTEVNTFWYLSVPMLEYALRLLRLRPIDYVYMPHAGTRLEATGLDSGLLSVACRATDEVALPESDRWAREAAAASWECQELFDLETTLGRPASRIEYAALDERFTEPDGRSINLARAVSTGPATLSAARPEDGAVLRLGDRT